MDVKVDTKVVVRLGRLLYFGKRDSVKGVLSEQKFKELMPGQDFATQFSRHLHPQKNVVQPMLEGLKDAGRGTLKDLTKATGLHLEIFLFLEPYAIHLIITTIIILLLLFLLLLNLFHA